MNEIPKRIAEVAQRLKEGHPPRSYKLRAVLKWFGAERRGTKILSEMKAALANLDLEAHPILDDAGIDDPIQFLLSASSKKNHPVSPGEILMRTSPYRRTSFRAEFLIRQQSLRLLMKHSEQTPPPMIILSRNPRTNSRSQGPMIDPSQVRVPIGRFRP